MLKRTIIFDLDDTLLAFELVAISSWLQVCSEYVQTDKRTSSQHLFDTIKKHSDWYWSDETRHREGRRNIKATRRSLVSAAFGELGLPLSDAARLADRFTEVRLDNMYMLPGVESTLQALCDGRFTMALLTNGESAMQREKIRRFGLEKYFSHIFIEGEMGFGKPEQEAYIKALADIGVSPDETYMIGDNLQWDVAAPQSLGIRSIWYDYKGTGLPPDAPAVPFRTILSITELLDILM